MRQVIEINYKASPFIEVDRSRNFNCRLLNEESLSITSDHVSDSSQLVKRFEEGF